MPKYLFQKFLVHVDKMGKSWVGRQWNLPRPRRWPSFHRNRGRMVVYQSRNLKCSTWNVSAWLIGLEKKTDRGWTWRSGTQLNISKWRNCERSSHRTFAENAGMGAFLMQSPRQMPKLLLAKFLKVRPHFNNMTPYECKHACPANTWSRENSSFKTEAYVTAQRIGITKPKLCLWKISSRWVRACGKLLSLNTNPTFNFFFFLR